ncbi:MAG: ABC transporter ATP-binding protein [Trueperaceae bacterium]|nr:ABC transporter ATP-binding protein [Trueperaceae bacterium]MBX3143081.1 ABC transporter ATP-binding protein [Trueperaceae bacterium]MCC6309642.1 ABC transporter ATP-binding protein [Trueperaceae bacterium]MCO5172929.1 ABC transporter ATP-binding protein [Trueperaceae bacterium]MCW5820260.1 ABC transporter ATP-binding protein [Trueperaceae bacterium]
MSERPFSISARDLRKTYHLGDETIPALAGVTLEVAVGEFVAVMGPSGSGKTTLLHMLGLLDQPDSGAVEVAGRKTAGLSDDELTAMRRDHLGFIFQSFELIPSLSARENILLPAEVAGRLAEARAKLPGLTALLGIEDRLDHRPRQLSGGQRQRVALARALINDPAVVLADEPTGNLDTKTGAEVLALLRRGVDESGWTVVMVTHDPAAATVADRIVFLRDGRVAGDVSAKGTEVRQAIDMFLAS